MQGPLLVEDSAALPNVLQRRTFSTCVFGNEDTDLYNDNQPIYRLQAVCAEAVSNCPFCKASHPLEKCF